MDMQLKREEIVPVRHGTLKLATFLVVNVLLGIVLVKIDELPSAVVWLPVLSLSAVKLFYPQGWQHWLRTWYIYNVVGCTVTLWIDSGTNTLAYNFQPYYKLKKSQWSRYDRGEPTVSYRVSGWGFPAPQLAFGWSLVYEEWWKLQTDPASHRLDAIKWAPPRVTLSHKKEQLHLSLEDALRLVKRLTEVDDEGWIKSVRPFSDLVLEASAPKPELVVQA